MNILNMPGFTAGASLYTTKVPYQREATRVGPLGNNGVIAQSKPQGLDQAQHVRDVLKMGQVHCEWFTYCEGNMGDHNQHCGIRQVCYWWPW